MGLKVSSWASLEDKILTNALREKASVLVDD